jgi:hypothetical protein
LQEVYVRVRDGDLSKFSQRQKNMLYVSFLRKKKS